MRISIRDLFEFGRRVLSVLFRHCESWGLEWSSLHKWTLPLLNRVTYIVLWTGGDTSALNISLLSVLKLIPGGECLTEQKKDIIKQPFLIFTL